MTDAIRDRTPDDLPHEVVEVPHLWIPLPDGTRLSARVWLPADAESHPVPGILEYLPYRKNDGTSLRDARNAPYFAGHGYAVVRVDMRGTGDSEGVQLDEYTQTELDDGVAVIAWIAAQTWCTGKVGIMGISWGGFNGLQIAALGPPELHAVVTVASTDDRYADDVHYFGGAVLADQMLPWATTMLAFNARPPDPSVWGETWLDLWRDRLEQTPAFAEAWLSHQRRDDFWKHGSICEDPAAVRAPVMAVGGWADAYRDAVFRMLESLDCPRRAVVGPWAHLYPHFAVPTPRIGFLQEALRWWDRWLKDADNGVDKEPALVSYVQDAVEPRASYHHRPGRWVADDVWPSPHVSPEAWHLAPGPALTTDGHDAAVGSRTYTVGSSQAHGVTGGRSCSFGAAYDMPVDQRHDDAFALCFDSEPLTEDVDILGVPEMRLEVAADQPAALVAVRVCDVAPDGASTLVTRGVLNLTHRQSHEHPEPLVPHQPYRVRFPLHAIGYRLPAGHRLRVSVAPTSWPLVWPSPAAVTLTVSAGPSSALLLPVRRGGDDYAGVFAPPEQSAFAHRSLPSHQTGTVCRDLTTGTVDVTFGDAGGFTLATDDGELRYADVEKDVFTIQDADPLSARCVAEREIEISRQDWHTKVSATAEMTADATHFHVVTRLTTSSGDVDVFDREWSFSLPRDHV